MSRFKRYRRQNSDGWDYVDENGDRTWRAVPRYGKVRSGFKTAQDAMSFLDSDKQHDWAPLYFLDSVNVGGGKATMWGMPKGDSDEWTVTIHVRVSISIPLRGEVDEWAAQVLSHLASMMEATQ